MTPPIYQIKTSGQTIIFMTLGIQRQSNPSFLALNAACIYDYVNQSYLHLGGTVCD